MIHRFFKLGPIIINNNINISISIFEIFTNMIRKLTNDTTPASHIIFHCLISHLKIMCQSIVEALFVLLEFIELIEKSEGNQNRNHWMCAIYIVWFLVSMNKYQVFGQTIMLIKCRSVVK